jgi:uncharacterized protein involved in exopolysaccharide biosynthesis
MIAGAVVVSGALFTAAALLLPPVYRSEASFVSNASDGLKLPGGLGGLTGLAGMASEMGVGLGADAAESPAFYVQLLRSRELLTRLLESRFADPRTASPADSAQLVDLLELGDSETRARRMELGVRKLRDDIVVRPDPRTNFVSFDVDMPHASLSAGVANRAAALVEEFNRQQRATRARAKRVFIGERLDEAERELRVAEDRHRAFLAQNREFLRSPTLVAQERRLERRMGEASDLAASLRRQYESARIEEVNDAPVVTVVDTAVAPQRPRWPRPLPVAALAIVTGLVLGTLAAGTATLLRDWARRNPADAAEVRLMKPRRRRGGEPPRHGDDAVRLARDAAPDDAVARAGGSAPVA